MTDRLPAPWGRRIDRDRVISFSFAGKNYQGLDGDTIASALAGSGNYLISRSFKYHRPRGPLTLAGHDANTLVHIDGQPNSLADVVQITEGLSASAINVFGSLQRDAASVLGRLSRFLPVGFYYKAFYKPRGMWEFWAPLIRRLAGLSALDPGYREPRRETRHGFYDVVVVGAGRSGMQAALAAAHRGDSVLLLDENPEAGGSLYHTRRDESGAAARSLGQQLSAEVNAEPRITLLTGATCTGWFADHWLSVIHDGILHRVRAGGTVLAVGLLQQPVIFRNNDLPGIMLVDAAQRLMHLYGVRPGTRAVVLAGDNQGYACALDLQDAGAYVAAVIDLRDTASSSPLADAVRASGIRLMQGYAVREAHAGKHGQLNAVEVRPLVDGQASTAVGERLQCDLLCMSAGFMPSWQLACMAGAKLEYQDHQGRFQLSDLPAGMTVVGSAAGDSGRDWGTPCAWPVFPHPEGKEFVDFDEDLQIRDILNATREGYHHIQLVKRYSTVGMGPSQGRHSALATARLVAHATGRTIAATGVTTARPPASPETLGQLAGKAFYPARRTAMHGRHVEAGATLLQAGNWYRPAFYGDDRDSAIASEVIAVRQQVAVIDVSTLGGLEIRGPDAAELMNRVYTYGFLKQPAARCRYALMTNEAGIVIDDGVACRLSANHFYVTATTTGVDRVYQSLLKWNAQWRLDVDIANVTTAWAAINIAGPHSREVLSSLAPGLALDGESFPYMGYRTTDVGGIPARVLRVGFVGELGYEVHVPQQCGEALWDAVAAMGVEPFGVEAQRVLRLEKGHVIIGQDTDAMSTPAEIGMDWAVSKAKPFFVGGRSIEELEKNPPRRLLAGFLLPPGLGKLPAENHLVVDGDRMPGRVTSCAWSPTLQRGIGLAYVSPEQAQPGSGIAIKLTDGSRIEAEIAATPFYDPDNQRQDL
jgi:sarcosine oxidase subunit alpha